MEDIKVTDLRRGALVKAKRALDPRGADVAPGTLGVVFERANAYGDEGGPMVRWFSGGCCNVYEGDVVVVRMKHNRDADDIRADRKLDEA